MSPGPLAVVDTSVPIYLLAEEEPGPDVPLEAAKAAEFVRANVSRLAGEGVRFVVPAPVLAELYSHPETGGDEIADGLFDARIGLQVFAYDHDDARATGEMLKKLYPTKSPGERKTIMKYDAQIAGMAHARLAKYLLTTNQRDFERYLHVIGSSVEVCYADGQPEKGQTMVVTGRHIKAGGPE